MSEEVAHRVLGADLAQCAPGSQIRLIGKVIQITADGLIVLTADDQKVSVTKPGDTPVSLIDPSSDQIQNDMILELIGEVNGDGSITAMLVIQFSSNFDMALHREAAKVANSPKFRMVLTSHKA